MSHKMPEIREYQHKMLMYEYNELMIRIKAHLFEFDNGKTSDKISLVSFPKPTIAEIDKIQHQVFEILKQDSKPIRHT